MVSPNQKQSQRPRQFVHGVDQQRATGFTTILVTTPKPHGIVDDKAAFCVESLVISRVCGNLSDGLVSANNKRLVLPCICFYHHHGQSNE
jgi:hypothetical protein